MRTLVTGGAGFIGSAVVRHLLAAGAVVLTVDALTYAGSRRGLDDLAEEPRHRFLHADIRDNAAMEKAFAEFRPQRVLHLAAESHVDRSIAAAAPFVGANVEGTVALLQAAQAFWSTLSGADREAFRFLHVSTDEVYGSVDTGVSPEDAPLRPSSPYGASKAAADHFVLAWKRTYGLPTLVSTGCNAFGPRQYPEKLIPLVVRRAAAGEPLPVYGDGRQIRDWLHVDDHARAIVAIAGAGAPGERVNIGGGTAMANLDLVRLICRIVDELRPSGAPHERLIAFVADRPGHDRRYAVDATRLRQLTGWTPLVAFEAGLRDAVAWTLANPDWWGPPASSGNAVADGPSGGTGEGGAKGL